MKLLILSVALTMLAACTTAVEPSETTSETAANGTTAATTEGGANELAGLSCWSSDVDGSPGQVAFDDVTDELNLVDPLKGMHGHAAIWTDADGDDRPDLYVGTFADREDEIYQQRGAEGAGPDRLMVQGNDGFTMDESLPEAFSRSSGGATADLDNDGDLDLVVSRNIKDSSLGQAPTTILENTGGEYSIAGGGIPEELGGRSVGVLDFDGDGLFDLFIVEDRFTGGSSVLLRNEGDLNWSDANTSAGLPDDVHGLGLVVGDFDNDGHQDLFVSGSNRLFLADGPGRFEEADSSVFQWETYGNEDDVAGASAADVNRDGLLDLAIGHHYNSTLDFGEQVPVRLYLNRGGGEFEDVTEAAGLTPLPTKAPHVELNDFDNDGWPDLLTSASAGDGPALFMHKGLQDGVPTFATPEGLGDPQYWVAAPTSDYNRDGRLDVFLVEWEPALPSLLLQNATDVGNWIQVSVDGENGFGIGWRVEVRDGEELLGARDITVTQGYSAGVLPVAHFGLGDLHEVEVTLTPPGQDPIALGEVAANQHIRWPGCG